MLGLDTHASTRNQMGAKAIVAPGSEQNGKHLLGSNPGSDDDEQYDREEAATMMDGLAEERAIEKKDELEVETEIEESDLDDCKTPKQGGSIGGSTRPRPVELIPGLWAGGGGAMTKEFGIDEETLLEEEKRLEL